MVTKAVLAKEIRKRGGVPYEVAASCVDVLIDSLSKALAGGEAVELRGLGTFQVRSLPEKQCRSLLSDNKAIPAHGRIIFRPSGKLREAAWNCRGGKGNP